MAVDETLEAAGIERIIELVGEVDIVAAVGDKDAELLLSSDEEGRFACCTAKPADSDEAGPDASCARSAIAPLRCGQTNDKY